MARIDNMCNTAPTTEELEYHDAVKQYQYHAEQYSQFCEAEYLYGAECLSADDRTEMLRHRKLLEHYSRKMDQLS